MSDQLSEFKDFVKASNGLVIWAVGAGLGGAVIGEFAGIAPPWPSSATAITCAMQLLALMYVFLVSRDSSKRDTIVSFRVACALCLICLPLYLVLFSLFVFTSEVNDQQIVGGLICTHNAEAVYPACPFLGLRELGDANYDREALWTSVSITAVEMLLFLVWLFLFFFFMRAVAVFVVYTKGRPSEVRIH